ncbi:MAG: hypothetical protein ACYDBB_03855 [Armatimonadota bacterium]
MPAQTETRLFFDRHWISNAHGPRRAQGDFGFTVCPPPKPAAPFLVADKPWESMSTGWGTLLYDQGRYRLWYEAWDKHYRDDFDGRLCYAESDDGITWRKPELGLVEYEGSTRNNLIFDGKMAGGMGFHGHSVFIDPTSPPEARYRMIFMTVAHQHCNSEHHAFHPMSFAYSADGIGWRWGKPEPDSWLNPPFAAFGSDTQTVVYWDPDLRCYVGYFRTWGPQTGRAIGRATTHDFTRWSHPQTIVTPDERDPFGSDLYNNAAARYVVPGDTGHFFFISVFDHDEDTLSVQLATSRDGIRYSRLDRTPFIPQGDTYDRGGIYTCPGIQQIGDELVMAFHGVNFKHGEAAPANIRDAGSYALLRFPRDRFQGLQTGNRFEFNTPAFRNTGAPVEITLNATVQAGGSIRAGLMPPGESLMYLEGFAPEDCTPVDGDGTALALRWRGDNRIPIHLGEQLELRLIMEKSTLYSVTFTSEME